MKNKKKIIIIGAGVSGLTTGLSLLEEGYEITIIAEKFAPDIVSVVAGALWEWPPAVCGFHQDVASLERSKDWCMTSYEKFFKLAEKKETGVKIKPVIFYFKMPVNSTPSYLNKMNELKGKVKEFRHDAAMIKEEGVNEDIGLVDAYSYLAPIVDTDVYMDWLFTKIREKGVEIIQRKVTGDIVEQSQALLSEYNADFIINCTGLGAAKLANDQMYPLRGALVRIHNYGTTMPYIDKAYCISHDDFSSGSNFVFIVPRGNHLAVIGGLAEENEWDTSIRLDNYKPIQDMLENCIRFLPMLKNATIEKKEPVRTGLRPLRKGNVRLEKDPKAPVIHNYGHGGSGVTFSWGCANEIINILKREIPQNA